jgi:hypothetical protein
MAPDGIVEPVDIAAMARSAGGRVWQAVRQTSPDLTVLKNLSTMALPWQFPLPDIETRMPRFSISAG